MNNNYENYKTSDLDELNQKIHNRFIRNVVKPSSNHIKPPPHFAKNVAAASSVNKYRIPRSSEILSGPTASKGWGRQEVVQVQDQAQAPYPPRYFTPLSKERYPPPRPPLYYPPPTPVPQQQPKVVHIAPNCQDINLHINTCPICQKLYQPYNSVLMVIIVILIIIILFMMKKMFNF